MVDDYGNKGIGAYYFLGAMPKKSTQLEQLSEKIHITVEKMRNLGVENLDHMFLEIYV